MLKQTFSLLGCAFLVGCGGSPDDARNLPATSRTVLPDAPDFTPKPSDVPVSDGLAISATEFPIHITTDGKLYRNGTLTNKAEIVDELLSISNLEEVTVMVHGNSDVKVSLVMELQSHLSEAVPNLGNVVISVRDSPDGA